MFSTILLIGSVRNIQFDYVYELNSMLFVLFWKVTHTPEGMETLKHFLFDVCGISAGWKMEDVLEEEIKVINNTVGPDEHVICALSGGVDSTVAATIVHKAIGDRLHCVFVDNGLLR